jgi:hypothetical protein
MRESFEGHLCQTALTATDVHVSVLNKSNFVKIVFLKISCGFSFQKLDGILVYKNI